MFKSLKNIELKNVKRLAGSLQVRVLLMTVLGLALGLPVAGFTLTRLFEAHVEKQFQNQLMVYFDHLLAGVAVVDDQPIQIRSDFQNIKFNQPLSGLYWQINDESGAAVLRSRSLWDERLQLLDHTLKPNQPQMYRLKGPANQEVMMVEQTLQFGRDSDRIWRLSVAQNTREMTESIAVWRQQLVMFLLILFVVLLVAALVQVVLGLSPLRRLQQAFNDLKTGHSTRLIGHYPAELQGLVQDFNGVLDAYDSMTTRARAQAGDLAHAIKTPIAVISLSLDQAKQINGTDSDFVRLIRKQLKSLQDQVNWRLKRARVASNVTTIRASTLVSPVVESTLRTMKKLYVERDLQFIYQSDALPMTFQGEDQDFKEILGNLVDNAAKWANRKVCVSVFFENAQLHVRVEDDGPGIAEMDRLQVLQRGTRLDEGIAGTGLGLAIVKELCGLYQGHLKLEMSIMGGLAATVVLPGRHSHV
jgi:signal transduction histidine kinase